MSSGEPPTDGASHWGIDPAAQQTGEPAAQPTGEPTGRPTGEPAPSYGPPTEGAGDGWARLDPLMLVVGPVQSGLRFAFPALIAFFGIGRGDGTPWWMIFVFILAPALFGLIPWFTTYYRITDAQLQVRRGLINRNRSTAPLDRVRSVDLEASFLHRILGLSKVQIGTGVDDTRIMLDSLSQTKAQELREFLLGRGQVAAAPGVVATANEADDEGRQPLDGPATSPVAPTETLASIDWSWLRFAPLSITRLAVLAGAIGLLTQVTDAEQLLEGALDTTLSWVQTTTIWLLAILGVIGFIVVWLAVSMGGYALQWWDYRLIREQGSIRMSAGLLTTRSISVEERRIRGIRLRQPLLLRVARGAELDTLATGVGSGGTTTVLPAAPLRVAHGVGEALVQEPGALDTPLHSHGPAARRRLHVREQLENLMMIAIAIGLTVFLEWSWWVPVGVAVGFGLLSALTAEVSYRTLGHALTAEHLIARNGTYQRQLEVLERDGVIGWVIEQSFFQRRLGLSNLVATTAAGGEKVVIPNVALERAVALADAVTPEVGEFLSRPGSVPDGGGARSLR